MKYPITILSLCILGITGCQEPFTYLVPKNNTDLYSQVMNFEETRLKEHQVEDINELEPKPIVQPEVQPYEEIKTIDISNEVNTEQENFDIDKNELIVVLFLDDERHKLSEHSREKMNKLVNILNRINKLSVQIESNYFSLNNNQYNYSNSVLNGQYVQEILLSNTKILQNDITILPFGGFNKICNQDTKKCFDLNNRIVVKVKIEE